MIMIATIVNNERTIQVNVVNTSSANESADTHTEERSKMSLPVFNCLIQQWRPPSLITPVENGHFVKLRTFYANKGFLIGLVTYTLLNFAWKYQMIRYAFHGL